MDAQSSQLDAPSAAPRDLVRVLLDARKVSDGGIGVYIQNLVRGFAEAGGVSLTLLVKPGERPAALAGCSLIVDSSPCYSLDEMLFLARRIPWQRFDLFHTPHYVLPLGVPIPSVVTVHDLIHVEQPERFFYPWVAKRLMCSAVRRASVVLAVSEATRQAVIGLAGAEPSKIRRIPNAIAPAFLRGSSVLDLPAVVAEAGSFFFSLFSNLKPHKGIEDLFEAYRQFKSQGLWRQRSATCPKLVIAGIGADAIARSPRLAALVGSIGDIMVLGKVGEGQLAALYRRAAAVVVASRLEGFCLPALEAQAVGTPVVCRPVPALCELVTERDVVAADMSAEGLRDALAEGLQGAAAHGRAPYPAHLALYSPARTAAQVVEAYRAAVATEAAR